MSDPPPGALVFVDTSAWVAVTHAGDRSHARARSLFGALVERQCRLVTLLLNLYEAVTVLNVERPYRPAWVLPDGQSNPYPELLLRTVLESRAAIQELDGPNAWQPLTLIMLDPTRRLSVFDCAAFLQIQREGIEWAFAFDQDFDEAGAEFGFRVIGP